ncbi:hypothetical protein AAHA92_14223 [Salvia divinorum]|uniref:Uncharacterized protein n=1 Tax=Salvia divinorum TaxID=28513 RepID=A0ABD1HAV1_SALDI
MQPLAAVRCCSGCLPRCCHSHQPLPPSPQHQPPAPAVGRRIGRSIPGIGALTTSKISSRRRRRAAGSVGDDVKPAGSVGDDGEPAGSVGDDGEPANSLANANATAVTSRSGVPTGGIASGVGDATSDSVFSPKMSNDDFMERYVVSEADKALWEECVVEADREVIELYEMIAWNRCWLITNHDLGEIVLYILLVAVGLLLTTWIFIF